MVQEGESQNSLATVAAISQPHEFLSLPSPSLFMEILNSCSDCDEIQFMEDGSWCPMKPKKEASEVCPPPGYGLDGE